ncbi:MAG: hypothetical protein EOO39_38560 [Cytophagaceae bacterium]|nr:MAG: hypothetical protein EOO39_38560 [Cytophagaceae bacterium]
MTLFTDISEIKTYLGRAINVSATYAFMRPYIDQAQTEFIEPAIGSEMLAELQAQINSTDQTELTPVNRLLLGLVRQALAFYAYQKYLPYSLGNDGDNGLQEQGTDASKPVRMGVLDVRRRETAENAAKALEKVLVQLFTFPDQYPTWQGSEAYQSARALFIASGTELTRALPQAGGSYRLFVSLKPYLREAERLSIISLLGKEQYQALKAGQLAGDLDEAGELLLEHVSRTVATVAYAEALYNLNVVQTPGGQLRILSDFDGIYNQKAVTGHDLAQAQRRADGKAAVALTALKSFLTANADDYPLYKTSDRFTAKGPNTPPDNSQYTGIFRMR